MVERGISNSRMKDYFDLWVFTESFEFDGATLAEAIRATFEWQRTPLPAAVPVGLSVDFAQHPQKLAQWRAFVSRGRLKAGDVTLPEVVARIHDFLMPPITALITSGSFARRWKPSGGWK